MFGRADHMISVSGRCMAACIAVLVLSLAEHAASAQNADSGRQRQHPSCHSISASTVPAARLAILRRGFNLTGWLDGENVRRPDPAVLASLRRRGFTHIRLPVSPERFIQTFADSRQIARYTAELDSAIDSLIAMGFGVSLDFHPGSRLNGLHVAEPTQAFELIQALWRNLARRYADRPADQLFFEALNEPSLDGKTWNSQGPLLVEAIRREAPNHTIIYGPSNYQRIDALLELEPLPQPNIVYAVHFYDPMVFTHQGLNWSDDPLRYLHGVPFPAHLADPAVVDLLEELTKAGKQAAASLLERGLHRPWTTERIANEISKAGAWAKRHQSPVIVNEFGVLGWKVAVDDRARWLETVRRSAERHCIGWTHWDYAEGFGFVRRLNGMEIPDEALLRALLD
jgi:endoglucanase